MIDLNKSLEFFNPTDIEERIHIIGLGAIGSNLIDTLVRLGFTKFSIYDFDTVSSHNIANQRYTWADIGQSKLDAIATHMLMINGDLDIVSHHTGWQPDSVPMSGYVFLCLDNIDLRRDIIKKERFNPNIKAFFDFRMRLEDAQHYAAKTTDDKAMMSLLESMNFTHEEAMAATPVSACGTTLNVMPTVMTIVAAGVANFMQLTRDKKYKTLILVDPFKGFFDRLPLD